MAKKIDLAKLVVTLEAQNAQYISALEKAEQRADKWEAKAKSSFNNVKKMLAPLAAAFGAIELTHIVRQTQEVIDQQAKLADNLGFTLREFQALELQARLDGVAFEALRTDLTKFIKNVGDAKQGLDAPIKQFERLGITVDDLRGKSSFEVLDMAAKRFQGIGSEIDKTNIALGLFGRAGLDVQKLLESIDARGIEALVDQVEFLGTAVSRVDAAKVEAANDALTLTVEAGKGLATTLAVELAPALEKISNWFTAIVTTGNEGLKKVFTVTKFLAEEISAAINGAALGDLPRLYEQLGDQQERLVTLQRVLDLSGGAQRQPMQAKQIEQLQQEIEKTQELIALSEQLGANKPATAPTPKTGGEDTGAADNVVKIDEIIAKLQQQVALHGKTGEAAKLAYEMQAGLARNVTQEQYNQVAALDAQLQALDEQAKAAAEAKKAEEAKKVDVEALVRSLDEQVATFGKTGEAARLSYMMQHGMATNVTEADLARVAALDAQLQRLEAEKQLSKELQEQEEQRANAQKTALEAVEALRVQAMTDEEQRQYKLIEVYGTLQNAVALGQITQADANTLYKRLEEQSEKAKENVKGLEEYAKEAARNIHNSLADFFFDPLNDGFDGLLKKAVNVLRRIAAETAATFVENKVKGWLSGFGNTGGIMGAISKFAGFFDSGGHVPAGQFAIAAERRSEFVDLGGKGFLLPGPADVTSGAATAAAMAQGGRGDVDIKIINNGAPVVVRSQSTSQQDDKTIVEMVIETVDAGFRNGSFDATLGGSYGLSRARGSMG